MQLAEDPGGIGPFLKKFLRADIPWTPSRRQAVVLLIARTQGLWSGSTRDLPALWAVLIPLLRGRADGNYATKIERPVWSCEVTGRYLLGIACVLMQRFTLYQVKADIDQASSFLHCSRELSSRLPSHWRIYQAALYLRHAHLSFDEDTLGRVPAIWESVSHFFSVENQVLAGLDEALTFVWRNGRIAVNERTVLTVPVEYQIQIDMMEPAAALLTALAAKRDSWTVPWMEYIIHLQYQRLVFRFWFLHLKSQFFSEGGIISDSFPFKDIPLCWLQRKPSVQELKALSYQVAHLATTQSLSFEERLFYARDWCDIIRILNLPDGYAAYSVLLETIHHLISFKMSIKARHQRLMKGFRDNIVHLVNNAISMAIDIGDFELGITWMESSRSLVCHQLLQLRTPLGPLRAHHPDLADRFIALSSGLQLAQALDDPASSLTAQHQNRVEQWEGLIKEIRTLPSFRRFLQPQSWQDITHAASQLKLEGTIVYMNVDEYRCDALAVKLTGGGVQIVHVPLSDFSLEIFMRLYSQLKIFLCSRQAPIRADSTRLGRLVKQADTRKNHPLASVLSELWIRVVKPIIMALGIEPKASGPRPRFWWCPCGLSTFLPLHAAGLYTEWDGLGSNIFDYVVSSYIPTASMLHRAGQPQEVPPKPFHLLAVAEAEARGWANLPGTKLELELINKHSSSSGYRVTELVRSNATADATKQEMESATWVHFACHGIQDTMEPTSSALILSNGSRLTYLDLIRMNLPHAQFAFLSACQTAMGTSYLSHEFAHLATGMLMAGYRGVIGTMWAIRDDDAPFIADLVYKKLFEGGKPDHTQAASALADAVCALRQERRAPFESWVPFVHIGI